MDLLEKHLKQKAEDAGFILERGDDLESYQGKKTPRWELVISSDEKPMGTKIYFFTTPGGNYGISIPVNIFTRVQIEVSGGTDGITSSKDDSLLIIGDGIYTICSKGV